MDTFEFEEKQRLLDLMDRILSDKAKAALTKWGCLDDMLCLYTIADYYFGNELTNDEAMTWASLCICRKNGMIELDIPEEDE